MNFIAETQLDYDDVIMLPQRSMIASRDLAVERTFNFVHTNKEWTGCPIVASNMDTVGTFGAAKVLTEYRMLTCIHKFYALEDWNAVLSESWYDPAFIIPSVGTKEEDRQKFRLIYQAHQRKQKPLFWLCIDIANGYSEILPKSIKIYRKEFPELVIIAGNVVTGNMTEGLILSGADIVKVGIGSSKICRTRTVAGVGRPQFSANIDCADKAKGLSGWIMADGGCSTPGDVAKALASVDGFAMLGSTLAAHEENTKPENIEQGERKFAIVYGMSSESAMKAHHGGKAKYRSSEGITAKLPFRGKLSITLDEILGGIRSAMTYSGAKKLKELNKRATFIKVNRVYDNSLDRYAIGK
jgi:GMP reductase